MTFLELQTEVHLKSKLSRVSVDGDLDQVVKNEINRAIYDLAREKTIPELLVLNTEITIAPLSGTPLVPLTLPEDFLIESRLTYQVDLGVGGNKAWTLDTRDGMVSPAPVYGSPKAYVITSGSPSGVWLEPPDNVDSVTDKLYLDYYKTPAILIADDDAPVSLRWDAEIIRRSCAAIAVRDNQLDKAAALSPMHQPAPPPK